MKKIAVCLLAVLFVLSTCMISYAESRASVEQCPVCNNRAIRSTRVLDEYWITEPHGDHSDNIHMQYCVYVWRCARMTCSYSWEGEHFWIREVEECPFNG